MKILVVDIGGTNVKFLASGQDQQRKIPSGRTMTPELMVPGVKEAAADWDYEAVSIGYPGPVLHGRPVTEPWNLGSGWVGFDFEKAFGHPVKIINDAAMQALGSYEGGRMLFLGLGTGLGTALIIDGKLEPMELAHMQYRKRRTFEDYLGLRGLERLGKKKWEKHVWKVVELLKNSLGADYVVLGGGNARKLEELPPDTRVGDNANAFKGGFRLWEDPTVAPGGQIARPEQQRESKSAS
jgi:polyphosphate glucokinase